MVAAASPLPHPLPHDQHEDAGHSTVPSTGFATELATLNIPIPALNLGTRQLQTSVASDDGRRLEHLMAFTHAVWRPVALISNKVAGCSKPPVAGHPFNDGSRGLLPKQARLLDGASWRYRDGAATGCFTVQSSA